MEKIRITLWDFFTFFMTGVLAGLVMLSYLLLRTEVSFADVIDFVAKASSATTIAGISIVATLAGMLIEPFANLVDKFLNRRLARYAKSLSTLGSADEAVRVRLVEDFALNDKVQGIDPYYYARDYVDQLQLGPNLIIFLSRFGFYRNAMLISLISGSLFAATSDSVYELVAIVLGTFLVSWALKYRGDQFYSYMAPLVYRATLIHRLRTRGREDSQ